MDRYLRPSYIPLMHIRGCSLRQQRNGEAVLIDGAIADHLHYIYIAHSVIRQRLIITEYWSIRACKGILRSQPCPSIFTFDKILQLCVHTLFSWLWGIKNQGSPFFGLAGSCSSQSGWQKNRFIGRWSYLADKCRWQRFPPAYREMDSTRRILQVWLRHGSCISSGE